jgi:hypothetical protein
MRKEKVPINPCNTRFALSSKNFEACPVPTKAGKFVVTDEKLYFVEMVSVEATGS